MGFLRDLFGKKESAHPDFFQEMKILINSILIPQGFQEDEHPQIGRAIISSFSRDNLSVGLHWEPMDGIFYMYAENKEDVNSNEKFEPELLLELNGTRDSHKDEFISKATVMLKEWLAKKNA